MSASQNPRPKTDEELFDEPDYDAFSDAELDALYRGESVDSVKASRGDAAKIPTPTSPPSDLADLPDDAEDIDPELAAELQAELDDELLGDLDDDWDGLSDDEFDDL